MEMLAACVLRTLACGVVLFFRQPHVSLWGHPSCAARLPPDPCRRCGFLPQGRQQAAPCRAGAVPGRGLASAEVRAMPQLSATGSGHDSRSCAASSAAFCPCFCASCRKLWTMCRASWTDQGSSMVCGEQHGLRPCWLCPPRLNSHAFCPRWHSDPSTTSSTRCQLLGDLKPRFMAAAPLTCRPPLAPQSPTPPSQTPPWRLCIRTFLALDLRAFNSFLLLHLPACGPVGVTKRQGCTPLAVQRLGGKPDGLCSRH